MSSPHISHQQPPMKFYMVQIGKTFKVYKNIGTAKAQITRHKNRFSNPSDCFLWESGPFEWQAFSEIETCSVCSKQNHSKGWKHDTPN